MKPYHRRQLRIYIASKFASRDRIRQYKKAVEEMGYICLSHWIDDDADMPVDQSSYMDSLANNFEQNEFMAQRDIEDVYSADIFLICTEDESTTGGRDVELGMALMYNHLGETISGGASIDGDKILMRVGPMRNVFHALVKQYNWTQALHFLNGLMTSHNDEEDYNEREWQKRLEANQS